jgi:hypothetical protein
VSSIPPKNFLHASKVICSDGHEVHRFSGNQSQPPLNPVQGQVNLGHTYKLCFSKIHFNIILAFKRCCFLRFSDQNLIWICHLPHACCISHLFHTFWFKHPSNIMRIKVTLSLWFNWAPRREGVLGSGVIVPRIIDFGTRWRWVVSFTPRPLYSQGKTPWYPLYRKLGMPQRRSGRGEEEKNSQPLPRLELPIIQPVAQRYTTELSRLQYNICNVF